MHLSGQIQHGTLSAENPAQLKELLLQTDIALLSYTECTTKQRWLRMNRALSPQQASLITFFEFLKTLLDSGVPLARALELATTQVTHPTLSGVLLDVTHLVQRGQSLSDALKKYPNFFPPLIIQLIKSGEKTGQLSTTLAYIEKHLRDKSTLTKTLIQAATFPLFTLAFAIIIMAGIFLCLIPQFESFFSSLHKTLPPLTQTILNISAWLRSWHGGISMITLLVCGIILVQTLPLKLLQKFYMHLPIIGPIVKNAHLIQILRMFSLFLKSGVPLKEALEVICTTIKNVHLQENVRSIARAITAGQNITNQLSRLAEKSDRELLRTFISLGEQTGKLDSMLEKAALIFEEKLKSRITRFTLYFQPALIIGIGIIIALLMAAVYLPLFNLAYSVT